MRDYSKISPQFWIGTTGRKIKSKGRDSVLISMYLLTNPHANMLGLYYLPTVYISHETGLSLNEIMPVLDDLNDVGFCDYDPITEYVWIYNMARFQIAEELKESDNRTVGVNREYESLPDNPFLHPFYRRYEAPFKLLKQRGNPKTGAIKGLSCHKNTPLKPLSKPLASQEQEQEQEQEHERAGAFDGAGVDKPEGFFKFDIEGEYFSVDLASEPDKSVKAILNTSTGEIKQSEINPETWEPGKLEIDAVRIMGIQVKKIEQWIPAFRQYIQECELKDRPLTKATVGKSFRRFCQRQRPEDVIQDHRLDQASEEAADKLVIDEKRQQRLTDQGFKSFDEQEAFGEAIAQFKNDRKLKIVPVSFAMFDQFTGELKQRGINAAKAVS